MNTIHGDVIIMDLDSVVQMQALNLITMDGNFILKGLTSLVSLEIPNLIKVNSIDWEVVPILNNVEWNSNLKVKQNIIISDTSITNLDNNFNKVETIEILNINNNRFLETIKTNIKFITKQFNVHANAKELELEMPYLQDVKNITIRDTSAIWFPNLIHVESSMEFIENSFTHLEVPNLKDIGGTLGIIDNLLLDTVDFNNVTDIKLSLIHI